MNCKPLAVLCTGVVGVCAFAASPVEAGIILTPGNHGTGQTENVLYNHTGLLDNGPHVQGITNQSSEIVDITSSESMHTPSGGQARFEAIDGSMADASISMNDPLQGIVHVIINLHIDQPLTATVTGHFVGGGSQSLSANLSGNGQNFITITTDNGATHTNPWTPGVGLHSMHQRALELGGTFHTGPNPDGGHHVTARLPT